MDGDALRDDRWGKVKPFVSGRAQRQARPAQQRPPVLRCAVADGSSGASWRDLPEVIPPECQVTRPPLDRDGGVRPPVRDHLGCP